MHHSTQDHEQNRREGCCESRDCRRRSGPEGHLEETVSMWESAFQRALFDLHVDALKEKIRKNWGKNIESIAEEFASAMTEEWKASSKQENLRRSLEDIIRKGFTKGPQ